MKEEVIVKSTQNNQRLSEELTLKPTNVKLTLTSHHFAFKIKVNVILKL